MATSAAVPRGLARPAASTNAQRARRTDRIVGRLRVATPDERTRSSLVDELIETNVAMARSMAARYRNRGIDLEDLEQVALLALTKAAQRFDPSAGHDFMVYAVPTIRGELRRFFRDSGWMVRPPRRVQELQACISHAQNELESRLGRSPRPSEVAAHLAVPLEEVVEALTADGCFAPTSLDRPIRRGREVLADVLADDGRDLDCVEVRTMLSPILGVLAERDLLLLRMRFIEQRTQQEIGDAVGLTQAQVSRRLTSILRQLRAELEERPAG